MILVFGNSYEIIDGVMNKNYSLAYAMPPSKAKSIMLLKNMTINGVPSFHIMKQPLSKYKHNLHFPSHLLQNHTFNLLFGSSQRNVVPGSANFPRQEEIKSIDSRNVRVWFVALFSIHIAIYDSLINNHYGL